MVTIKDGRTKPLSILALLFETSKDPALPLEIDLYENVITPT